MEMLVKNTIRKNYHQLVFAVLHYLQTTFRPQRDNVAGSGMSKGIDMGLEASRL